MMHLEVPSEMAVVAVCDPSVSLPSSDDQDVLVRELEALARDRRVFYLLTDDPVRYRIGLLTERPPPTLGRDFESSGGTFGLELQSGKVALYGWRRDGVPVLAGSVESTRGGHVLSVLARRPFEGSRYAEDMTVLLGAHSRYVDRVNRLGLIGCLPLVATAIAVLARKWNWLWYLFPILAVSWLPYLVLRQSGRYKKAQRKAQDAERARPHFVFSIIPTEQDALPGGFLRV